MQKNKVDRERGGVDAFLLAIFTIFIVLGFGVIYAKFGMLFNYYQYSQTVVEKAAQQALTDGTIVDPVTREPIIYKTKSEIESDFTSAISPILNTQQIKVTNVQVLNAGEQIGRKTVKKPSIFINLKISPMGINMYPQILVSTPTFDEYSRTIK